MPRKKKLETETPEPVEPPEPKQRKPNPLFLTAVLITDRLCPDGVSHPAERERVLAIQLKGLSRLCGTTAKKNDWPVYDLKKVYLAWMALADKAIVDDWGKLPNVEAVTHSYSKTGKPWIDEWCESILSEMPPVWDSKNHDDYIREHWDMLRLVGFQYRGWSTESSQFDGSRIPYSEIEEYGLLPKENHEN